MTLSAATIKRIVAGGRPRFIEVWPRLDEIERAQVEAAAARTDWETPGDLAMALDPLTVQTPMLKVIDKELVAVRDAVAVMYARRRRFAELVRTGIDEQTAIEQAAEEIPTTGIDRLALSAPPQEGKSQRVTRYGVEWLLRQFPQLRIGMVSYDGANAGQFSYQVRADIELFDGSGEQGIDLGLRLARDQKAMSRWLLRTGGGVIAIGIGGGLTGRPLDCFTGETRITTENGYNTIHNLAQSDHPPRVLSWNHATERAEWKRIEASRVIADREVIEVVTTAGRRFTCTPEHQIWTTGGYTRASLLRPGDTLRVGWREPQAGVRDLRQGSEVLQPDVPGVLRQGAGRLGRDVPVRSMRTASDEATMRDQTGQTVLLTGMLRRFTPITWSVLSPLWQADRFHRSWSALLLAGMPECIETSAETEVLPALRCRVRVFERPTCLLLVGVFKRCSLAADDRRRQLAFQGRDELRAVVPQDAPADQGTRRRSLSGLRTGKAAGHPSRRRGAVEQPARESDHALPVLPRRTSSLENDTVSVVRRLRGERHDVYDIQVEGNHNFFAEDVLAHNCMLIDDPVKDQRAADSLLMSEAAATWWQTVGRPRLAPWAPVIVVSVRWHEADLTGRLIAKQQEDEASGIKHYDRWRVVNIPAQADHDPNRGESDVLGREPGQYLVSARGRTVADWEATKAATAPRYWTAMYQGRPAPDAGEIWLRAWWRRYDEPKWSRDDQGRYRLRGFDRVSQSWDCAFRDKESSDYVVGQVWAKKGADSFLVYQVRARMSFTATLDAIRRVTALFPDAHTKYIEAKANGDAVMDALKHELTGITPSEPTQSKSARATAVSPFLRAGNAWLPTSSCAAADPEIYFDPEYLIVEATAFPHGAHDDQVDATSQYFAETYLTGGDGRLTSPTGMLPRSTIRRQRGAGLSPIQRRLTEAALQTRRSQ